MTERDKHIFRSLIANEDFRNWVLSPSENRDLYWKKWIETNHVHREMVNNARNSILKLKFKEDLLEEERLERILSNVISDKNSGRYEKMIQTSRTTLNWWSMIAASLLVIGLVTYAIYATHRGSVSPAGADVSMKKIANPDGRKSKISLPDGSVVFLNAGSTLMFPERFNKISRIVELEGEAFFEVAEEEKRPFVVKTYDLETHALGTAFNVRAYNGDKNIKIALVTGKVQVKTEKEPIFLHPGEKLTYNKSEFSYLKSDFDTMEETGWKDEILVFNNMDFQCFLNTVERWYGVEIKVGKPPSKRWSLNGRFEKESLQEVLMGIQFTHGIDFKINGKVVTINCESYDLKASK